MLWVDAGLVSQKSVKKAMDKLEWLLNTPEGRKELETCIGEHIEKEERLDKIMDRWCEKIHKLSVDDKQVLLNKVSDKYSSDTYRYRWLDRSIEPPEELFWVAYEYAKRYGKEYDEGYTMFVSHSLIVDDKFIVRRFDGQGSFIGINYKGDEM